MTAQPTPADSLAELRDKVEVEAHGIIGATKLVRMADVDQFITNIMAAIQEHVAAVIEDNEPYHCEACEEERSIRLDLKDAQRRRAGLLEREES